eukprot:TRINITY_DN3161_c0_g2_i1.p1 TRINITY_DN3161_c0_g2~~TRINITY_DN3161_c0_g2_i1.p1  ORF type:complete len:278 (-),score=15.87 TRINITY_DN3161_c0_g2_i1:426-1259(-)
MTGFDNVPWQNVAQYLVGASACVICMILNGLQLLAAYCKNRPTPFFNSFFHHSLFLCSIIWFPSPVIRLFCPSFSCFVLQQLLDTVFTIILTSCFLYVCYSSTRLLLIQLQAPNEALPSPRTYIIFTTVLSICLFIGFFARVLNSNIYLSLFRSISFGGCAVALALIARSYSANISDFAQPQLGTLKPSILQSIQRFTRFCMLVTIAAGMLAAGAVGSTFLNLTYPARYAYDPDALQKPDVFFLLLPVIYSLGVWTAWSHVPLCQRSVSSTESIWER